MRTAPILAVAFVLSGFEASASDRMPCVPAESCALPADLSSPAVFQARVELELRRAGGSRPDVLKELLAAGKGFIPWGNYVVAACQQGLIDCNNYLHEAEAREPKGPAESLLSAQLAEIRRTAALQRLRRAERTQVYKQALIRRATTLEGMTLYQGDVAERLVAERMTELLPVLRQSASALQERQRSTVAPYLLILEALASPRPTQSLVLLVRQGVDEAVRRRARRSTGVTEPNLTTSAEVAASLALRELRRMNAADTLGSLKAIIEDSLPGGSLTPERGGANGAPRLLDGNQPMASSVGELGVGIAEVVGDLGDRDFERQSLGHRTRWDQVSAAERTLVEQGKLRREEMVSR